MYQWRNRLKWMGVCIYTRVYDEKFLPKNSNSIVISRGFLHRRLLWVTKSENYKALPDIDPWTKEHQLITSRDSIKAEMVTPQPRHRSSRKHSHVCINRAHMGIPAQPRMFPCPLLTTSGPLGKFSTSTNSNSNSQLNYVPLWSWCNFVIVLLKIGISCHTAKKMSNFLIW